jgi:aminoglycoside phosphotransferase family enzyme/predicted kinase
MIFKVPDMTPSNRMFAGLCRPGAYPHAVGEVEHIETHISHVFLAGEYAYKIKKAVNLEFLDFSTLERRKFFCEEEVRLNGRLAPSIYLGVVVITGSPETPRVGGSGEALEYAVKMRRFGQDRLLTVLPLTGALAEEIAERVAAFHRGIPAAPDETAYGTPEAVLRPMRNNFDAIRARLRDPRALKRLTPLEEWTLRRHRELWAQLEARKREGHVRECHGDMHRGNIAYEGGELFIFDGIEFNPALRWIDTISELAFLIMDLEEAGELPQARRLLNRYLELTGDYQGLSLLDFYKVYRAMVRAKVIAIRLGQEDLEAEEAAADEREYKRYLDLAEAYTRPCATALYLTHGVSGTGKSRLSVQLRERLTLIHVCSDIERKRLFGLSPDADTQARAYGGGIYSEEAGMRTYARLHELAGLILDSGYSVLVDATFLKASQRRPFLELAQAKGVPVFILDLTAPAPVLKERVRERQARGGDASEAGVSVLESQLASQEPLTDAERSCAIRIDTAGPPALEDLLRRLQA